MTPGQTLFPFNRLGFERERKGFAIGRHLVPRSSSFSFVGKVSGRGFQSNFCLLIAKETDDDGEYLS